MAELEDIDGTGKWGREGAGVYILARDTGRILALKRSANVRSPRTWGIPGGKMEDGETPEQTAVREVFEEIRYRSKVFDLRPLVQFKTEDGVFKFNNFLVVVDKEFVPGLDHETETFKWVNGLEDWPEPSHHGVRFLRRDTNSQTVIKSERVSCGTYAG
ncbi:MAG: NUDIX hydrolase [Alphaproteobacteria bacterium]|nr:NUDIX hydrolase [Alphaproteobacteria bacterium]MCK5554613.1 NUDIX hydrolase [Alphaproteobacteria bacterium]